MILARRGTGPAISERAAGNGLGTPALNQRRRSNMLKKLLFGAGMAYVARKFMGGRRSSRDYDRRGGGLFGMGRSRPAGRGSGW